jgi:ABC-type nickel/cobalt efflux system permease component RcnA
VRRGLLASVIAVAVLFVPQAALAHPLGNFTVNRAAAIVLSPGDVRVEYVVDMAEIPTVQTLPRIDADGDGSAEPAERAAFAARTARELLLGVSVQIDGRAVALEVLGASAELIPGQAGLPTLRLEATFAGPAPEHGHLTFVDANLTDRVGWREVTAVGVDGVALEGSDVSAESPSDGLRRYPQDLLSSPPDVREASVVFAPGASAATDTAAPVAAAPREVGALGELVVRTGPLALMALAVAFGIGAVHALGPGHGKTLMAAYLLGSGGRVRQAVAVGGAVALMHTASVLGLGIVVVVAAEIVAPERLYPWLGLASGIASFALGMGLLVVRLRARRRSEPTGGHAHHEGHDHAHHEGHDHAHEHPAALSRTGLVALAVAGGILPSPTALLVLLASIAAGRILYGLALIASFSLGLASALVGVGIGIVRARDVVAPRLGARTARLVPLASALGIALLGLVLCARGVAQI